MLSPNEYTTLTHKTHNIALRSFTRNQQKVEAILNRIKESNDNHYDTSPEDVSWGDASNVAKIAKDLEELSDFIYQEGEYAETA